MLILVKSTVRCIGGSCSPGIKLRDGPSRSSTSSAATSAGSPIGCASLALRAVHEAMNPPLGSRTGSDCWRYGCAQADEQLLANSQKSGKLEEASRLLQKCFSCCLNDRSVLCPLSADTSTARASVEPDR